MTRSGTYIPSTPSLPAGGHFSLLVTGVPGPGCYILCSSFLISWLPFTVSPYSFLLSYLPPLPIIIYLLLEWVFVISSLPVTLTYLFITYSYSYIYNRFVLLIQSLPLYMTEIIFTIFCDRLSLAVDYCRPSQIATNHVTHHVTQIKQRVEENEFHLKG